MDNEFVSGQLRQLAAVEGKLEFILSVLERYDFPEETAARVRREHDAIAKRMKDTRLKMAVVGEFSSGKSSFINALLREELLETDVLQGTTVLSTMICYSETREIAVFYRDGGCERISCGGARDEFRERIRQLNRDTSESSGITRMEVGFPSELLKSGICIIDTPGTNSVNAWHDEVTRRIIREEADGCIVLTSAVNPMPMSLCGFLEENLPDMLSECVFIATKHDLLKEKDKRRAMDYIALKAAREFEIEKPLVLPYSSPDVLSGGAEAELSRESERIVMERLAGQKSWIQQRKILSLLRNTMSALLENMRDISEELEQRRAALEQAAVVDLGDFVGGSLKEKTALYDECFADVSRTFAAKLDDFCQREERALDDRLNGLSTGDEISHFLNGLPASFDEIKGRLLDEIGARDGSPPAVFNEAVALCEGLIEDFERDFKAQYPTLALLAAKETKPVKAKFEVAESWNTDFTANASLTASLNADNDKDARSICARWAGGAAAGAAVGSILPGIGTVAGFVIGATVGLFAAGKKSDSAKRAKALREKTAADYAAVRSRYFEELKLNITNELNKFGRSCRGRFAETLNEYLRFYREAARDLKERDDSERKAAERRVEEIRGDVRRLTSYIEETEELSGYLTAGKEL